MSEFYIGIFEDKSIITKNNLEEIKTIPYLKYIFKQISTNETWLFKYIHIDYSGSPIPLKAGNFEILDIGPDNRFTDRLIVISENNGKIIHRINFRNRLNKFFLTEELIPLIDILTSTDSIDIFIKLQKVPILETRIIQLEELLLNKNNELEELKKTIHTGLTD